MSDARIAEKAGNQDVQIDVLWIFSKRRILKASDKHTSYWANISLYGTPTRRDSDILENKRA